MDMNLDINTYTNMIYIHINIYINFINIYYLLNLLIDMILVGIISSYYIYN